MNTKPSTKDVRKINKFLREKVGFRPINTVRCCGEYRILKICYENRPLFFDSFVVKIHVEFKGNIITGSRIHVNDDLKWCSPKTKNRLIFGAIGNYINDYISPFLLVDKSFRNTIKIGTVKWIE
jgi:hypothetical protein